MLGVFISLVCYCWIFFDYISHNQGFGCTKIMIFLILLFILLTAIFFAGCRLLFSNLLIKVNISLFYSLFILIYSPQLSSLLFKSLELDKILLVVLVFTSPAFLLCFKQIKKLKFNKDLLPKISFKEYNQSLSLPYILLVLVFALISTWAIHNLTDLGFDGYAYHTSAMAWFNQHNIITEDSPFMAWVTSYPKNIEFLSLWIFKFDGNDQHIEGGNLLIHIITIPFAFGIGRLVGLSRCGSITAACLYFLTPMSLSQLRSTYIDQAFADCLVMAIYFLFYWSRHFISLSNKESIIIAILVGLSTGSLPQIKGSGLYVWIILGLMTLPLLYISNKEKISKYQLLHSAKLLAISFAFALLCGSGWYIKNYLVHDNPFWPMEFKLPVFGEIFPSYPGMTIEKLILNNWGVGDRSWLDIYWQQLTEVLSRPLDIDNRTGGWGFHFFSIGIPCMFLCLFWGNLKIKWLSIFAFVYFVFVPASFWPRYSIIVTLCSAIATLWIYEKLIISPKFKSIFNLISLCVIIISIIPFVKIFSLSKDRYVHKEWCGERYDVVKSFAPTTIAIANLLQPDMGMWYHYYGEKWQNKLVKFKNDNIEEYPIIACRMNKSLEYLYEDERLLLIHTDLFKTKRGTEAKQCIFINLKHSNIAENPFHDQYLPIVKDQDQVYFSVGDTFMPEEEIKILDSSTSKTQHTITCNDFGVSKFATGVQLTITHYGSYYPDGKFKYYINDQFKGGHSVLVNKSDKSQTISETFWCPVIDGKIYLTCESNNRWKVTLHSYQ